MDVTNTNGMALSLSLFRTAMFFERSERGFCNDSDIDWLIYFLDSNGVREEDEHKDSCDPTIRWTLKDGSAFAIYNPQTAGLPSRILRT